MSGQAPGVKGVTVGEPPARGRSGLRLRERAPLALAGIWILLAAVGPLVTPYGGTEITANILEPPSLQHPFGTDQNGMDVLSRTLIAPRFDVVIGVAATLIAAGLGLIVGLIAGYMKRFARLLIRVTDVFQSFPVFLLALAVMALAGRNVFNLIIVIGLVNTPLYARLTYAQATRLSNMPFVEAAVLMGMPRIRIIWKHVLPHSVVPIIAQFSMTVGWAILLTAGLSFVGAGVRPPTPEWGLMVAVGSRDMVIGHWWPAMFPGLALAVSIWSFANAGDWFARRWGETAV